MLKNKTVSYLLFAFALFFMAFFSCDKVNADFYDQEQNFLIEDSIKIDKGKNLIEFDIQYQNGINEIKVYVCANETDCMQNNPIKKSEYTVSLGTNGYFNPKSTGTAIYHFKNTNLVSGIPLDAYETKIDDKGKPDNKYYLRVDVIYIVVRDELNSVAKQVSGTIKYGYQVDIVVGGITGDAQINETLAKILYIINTIVIPILWGLMAILLVVRGILLGMDIVKSADEPDVRKKKIAGLIWLVIGVGVGFAITIVARTVMSMFGYGGLI